MMARSWGQIYDNIYGFIRLTKTEESIINSVYYQRLRWIKQLGFATYIFDGAEHTRFAHAIGVMHSADQMIRAVGRGVPDDQLFNEKTRDPASLFHKSVRIAALLHDIGTFPFSHSIEGAYIRFGKELEKRGALPGKKLPNNHEHLGSYIIKNSDFAGGISRILNEGGLDFSLLSKFIKGESESLLANQILHSDLDADRMDYLTRDAHHTGINYGKIDREYILYHLAKFKTRTGKEGLAVKENALHAVEDFLIARFAWYSQVVRNSSSAKYDILAAHIAYDLLKRGLIYRYDELLEMSVKNPEKFFCFNDSYFMTRIQDLYLSKKIDDPVIHEQMKMLIYRIPPKTIRIEESEHRILEIDLNGNFKQKQNALNDLENKLNQIKTLFKRKGSGKEWIIADIPQKDVAFTAHREALDSVSSGSKKIDPLELRDPVKILGKNGKTKFLIDRENALTSRLSRFVKFIPNVYGNEAAIKLLKKEKIIKE